MKRLRILTGRHVGAHLDLADGAHVVGAGNDCDITITDWTFAPLELVVAADGVTCRWYGQATPAAPDARPEAERRLVLADLAPREFDGIVLCVGPVDAPWPCDVQLLADARDAFVTALQVNASIAAATMVAASVLAARMLRTDPGRGSEASLRAS